MRNTLFAIFVLFELVACSQQQRVMNHTPALEYGEKGPAKYSDQLMNKLESGIDFIASGSEPFWSMEMDADKQIIFKTANGDSIITIDPEAIRLQDVAATSFRSKFESDYITAVVYDKPCIDNMSGKEYAKTVEITVAGQQYKGCGSYLSDYRLNDIWVLESINDVKINKADFQRGIPRIELSLTQNQIFAYAGCNEFSGSMEVQGKKIRFGRFSGTLTACPNMKFESDYLSHLANRTVPFRLEPGKLFLQVSADSTYNYKKVD